MNSANLNKTSISLSKLNELRFPDDPIPLRTLRLQAKQGKLAGAFRLHESGNYRVNLRAFDLAIADALGSAANDSDGASAEAIANKIYDEFK
jgi:hypothetical protein